jgi:two-component system cell cycle response regulator
MHPVHIGAIPASHAIALHDSQITLLADPAWRCSVLLVDDDELVRDQLAALLRLGGYEVHTAATGDEALHILDKRFCHIVLTDWQMPDMDGLALCRNLRRLDSPDYIYIVMLTIRSGGSDILAGLAAGADDYVVKGAPAEEILARLEVGRRITRLERSLRTSNRENRRMALTDPLTGARNRRYMMKYVPLELERSRRYDHPLAILSCDIDHFKQINDCFGHAAGDEVLQAFVTRCDAAIRKGCDWIARSGGEEFVFVLPETNLRGASCLAARLREILAMEPISTSVGPLSITISVGATALETAHELASVSAADLLAAADRCLYVSKNMGRDRATAASVDCNIGLMPNAQPGASSEVN